MSTPSTPGRDPEAEVRTLGDLLLQAGSISPERLRHAMSLQQHTGDPLERVLTHFGICDPDAVAAAVGARAGVATLAGSSITPSRDALLLVPEAECRRHDLAPLDIRHHRLRVAMADPLDADALAMLARHTSLRIEPLAASSEDIVELLREQHREQQVTASVHGLLERHPDESAQHVLAVWQRFGLGSFALGVVLAVLVWPQATLVLGITVSMLLYTLVALFKIRAVIASLGHESELTIDPAEAAAIPVHDLPIYTVLVPLYKELEVLPQLVRGLERLDYPESKLDVKLLLEEDDVETVAAARAMHLPAFIDVVVTPDSQPKTKPKSCNYGLLYARGEYTVIFDAEDVPERDQLRKAVAAFRRAPDTVVCLQGQLNYYNREQNLLTRWFTGEYSGWFDMLVPGLDNLDLPIPLGGTSNHFRTDVLIDLGAWDPFNVTEDADLGVRLFYAGYKTATLNSTTFEEANSETFNWIRQRSRWVKGYIQTWLVHTRSPLQAMRAVGVRNFLAFQVVIGGTFMVLLLNPLQWLVLLMWCLTAANITRQLFPSALYYLAWTSFLFGNFAFVYINALAVMRRGYWRLLEAAIISPLYWCLMSIAAWRGLVQLITAPSYWEKTEHGLHDGSLELVSEELDGRASSLGRVA